MWNFNRAISDLERRADRLQDQVDNAVMLLAATLIICCALAVVAVVVATDDN